MHVHTRARARARTHTHTHTHTHTQRDNGMQLELQCEEQLFRQEVEDADDLRLSVRLRNRCMDEKRTFCKEVEPGV